MDASTNNNYVVGRGELYFDRFADGTMAGSGEQYFGNTPSLQITPNVTNLDHYDSDHGLKVKDLSVMLQADLSGQFVTDNVSPDNLALWFLGDNATTTVTSQTGLTATIVAKLGRYYQLGKDANNPQGLTNLTNVLVTKAAATITMAGNYEVDLATGRIYILDTATDIDDADSLDITFDTVAGTRNLVIGKGNVIYGALRFIAKNPVGKQVNYFFPYVKLAPNSNYDLKGDTWQQFTFAVDVLKAPNMERVYAEQIGS